MKCSSNIIIVVKPGDNACASRVDNFLSTKHTHTHKTHNSFKQKKTENQNINDDEDDELVRGKSQKQKQYTLVKSIRE